MPSLIHNTLLNFFQIGLAGFFEQMFADTEITQLPNDQKVIVSAPKYFAQLNDALANFSKEGLGNWSG